MCAAHLREERHLAEGDQDDEDEDDEDEEDEKEDAPEEMEVTYRSVMLAEWEIRTIFQRVLCIR